MDEIEKIIAVRESFNKLDTNYSVGSAIILTELYNNSKVIVDNLNNLKTIDVDILTSLEELQADLIKMNSISSYHYEKESSYTRLKERLRDDLIDLLLS